MMSGQGTAEAKLVAANEEIRGLQAELRASHRQLKRLLEIVEKHQAQITAHESSIARLDRIQMEILTGRAWRALRKAADIAKLFVPGSKASASESVALAGEGADSFLVCDEPKISDGALRSGQITIRGWSLARAGVDAIQVEAANLPPFRVMTGIARPDVKKQFPELDKTGRAGFVAEFDSTPLPNGRHPISLRLISNGKAIRQTRTAIHIDHERGYISDYYRWIQEFEQPEDDFIALKLPSLSLRPKFSVLMPVYNTKPNELTEAIESVLAQSYENWELCMADDCSSDQGVREVLERFSGQSTKVKVTYNNQRGGISTTCNAAWRMATGEFVCFLDHDDVLAPHALAYLCEALDRNPEADLLYSDEDKINQKGIRFDPFMKPDWSPDLLLSENYICHLLVLRQDLARKIGTLNPDCDGSQDYDLILRASEQARKMLHVPRVLYHWRATEGSTAVTQDNKQYALVAAQKALQRHCARTQANYRIEPAKTTGRWRARYALPKGTTVSVIIASGGKTDVLTANLESLFAKTSYPDYEIVIIDNSKKDEIESLVREQKAAHSNIRYLDWRNKPFNYSAINNAAARTCDSPVLLFLNDDTSVIEPGWLDAMTELAMRPEVGAVGAKLLYPDGRIQHAGVVMGLYDNCGHAFKGLDGSTGHYFDFPDVIRNVSAVTGACLMTRAEVFWKAGGFDEVDFAIAFNDVDLCLKISSQGYRILYTPHALLYHHEAFSKTTRDLVPHPEEVESMRLKWDRVINADPYYSPNLTRNDEDWSLRTRK